MGKLHSNTQRTIKVNLSLHASLWKNEQQTSEKLAHFSLLLLRVFTPQAAGNQDGMAPKPTAVLPLIQEHCWQAIPVKPSPSSSRSGHQRETNRTASGLAAATFPSRNDRAEQWMKCSHVLFSGEKSGTNSLEWVAVRNNKRKQHFFQFPFTNILA